jgi:hypothetical protein
MKRFLPGEAPRQSRAAALDEKMAWGECGKKGTGEHPSNRVMENDGKT